eukprot:scaffold189122_cov30-Tisochrysis_lutea.AAC.5
MRETDGRLADKGLKRELRESDGGRPEGLATSGGRLIVSWVVPLNTVKYAVCRQLEREDNAERKESERDQAHTREGESEKKKRGGVGRWKGWQNHIIARLTQEKPEENNEAESERARERVLC